MVLTLLVLFSLPALCTTQVTGDVRLLRGNEVSSGIVQIYNNSSWTTVCGHTFTDQAAEVTCRQLGFDRGLALPLGAFGEYVDMVPYAGQFQQCATGRESRLLDCTFDDVSKCTPNRLAYASVTCINGQPPAEPNDTVTLDSGKAFPEAGYFTPVSVYIRETWGRVCGQFWDDDDARVVCRQLGYSGGLATYSTGNWTLPLLISEINCDGTEASLLACPQSESLCYDERSAAVVCNQVENKGFTLSLVGGKAHYGKVVVNLDGKSGLICNTSYNDNSVDSWTYKEAAAVCRQLGFTGGYVLDEYYDSGSISTMFLDRVTCPSGDEDTLLQCLNGGWSNVSTECANPAMGVSVYCYSEVRLAGSQLKETEQLHIGRVELNHEDTWYGVCASALTQEVAMVTCKQFGFSVAEIILPGSFGFSLVRTNSISSISCAGSEARLADCTYSLGRCEPNFHAALLCKHSSTPDSYTYSLSDSYYGAIIVERHGVSGYVCREGWDNIDARVMCKKAGYAYGVELNEYQFLRENPIWASKFTCTGAEDSLEDCGYETDMSSDWQCAGDDVVAGVLCFLGEPQTNLVRLEDGISDDHGRAEVFNDVTGWATICDSGWGNNDAAVFCRQAGFADGQTHTSAFRSKASSDTLVAMSSVKCEGTETFIFECGSNGWLSASSSCKTHSRDAGVYCYKYVRTSSGSFGAVQYHTEAEYGLVCADGFDANAANVVCKQKNFNMGLPVCCSGFGPFKNMEFSMSDVKCNGDESSLRDCSYTDVDPVCPSGHYAGVVCTHFNPGFISIKASPVIEINYFSQVGLVCSEGFTDNDARVVCKVNNFSYGKAFKASGKGLEFKIRWLRGLECSGEETNVLNCGDLEWGQIGVCSWDSVAAAICSNDQADMEFDIRLVNGSSVSGRVEIKVKNTWGTVCGRDFTRNEAEVICRHLNYHAGISMAAGHFGPGTGDIILSGIECAGNETSVTDCIWSGYGASSQPCDHSQDAAVMCFYNIRLAGSTTVNYGRLEMYDRSTDKWLAVCDQNLNVNNGNVICRQMGYVAGMFQHGSPLGPTTTEISIVSIDCSDTSECTFETGSCWSERYLALYCSENSIISENVEIRLPLSSFYGPVSIQRFGLWGHICSEGFEDNDAVIVCYQLGYSSGIALKTYATSGYPIIQGSIECLGDESSIEDCSRGPFVQDHGCYATDTVAGVLCYNEPGLTFGMSDLDFETGRMSSSVEIKANGRSLFVSQVKFTDEDAAAYCYALDYAGGETYHAGSGSYGVTDVSCSGTEESILECPAVWDPEKTKDKTGDLAGVTCYTAVRLVAGDPKYYGVVFTSKGVKTGPVCAQGFDSVDAGVACSNLGFDAGLVLCCVPFGNVDSQPVLTNVECTGSERQFLECRHEDAGGTTCSKDYAAVACYSGSKPKDYTLSFPASDTSTYAGNLVLTYMGINGSICMDGWDDRDAHVACRELGFRTGVSFNAAKTVTGPYWTSNVNCDGSESKLSQCQFTPFGEVTRCTSTLSHAGVICYDNEDIYSRLFGSGEARYGRVELSIAGEWRSLCNAHWDNEDAHVLCRMLDFRTGEAFQQTYNDTLEGPVWDINFMCEGSEASLTRCLSSGWKSSTSEACARHTNDAGAFCYTSVKLSTGVGRTTDQGAVLLYKDDMWYSVCADGFTDRSAQTVCKELGFKDGQAQCCSPYGSLQEYPRLQTHKVLCDGNETDVTECLIEGECTHEDYASVVCYGFLLITTESVTKAPVEKGFDYLPIIIAIVVFLCLLVLFVVVFYIVQKQKKAKKKKARAETFDSSIMRQEVDGSVSVENVLHGVARTPEVPRASYETRGGDHFATVSPVYRNASYDLPMQVNRNNDNISSSEYANQGSNRTVLNISTSGHYDRPSPRNNSTEKSHIYDSPRNNSTEKPHIYDNLLTTNNQEGKQSRIDNEAENTLTMELANQDEVSSPTDDQTVPRVLQAAVRVTGFPVSNS